MEEKVQQEITYEKHFDYEFEDLSSFRTDLSTIFFFFRKIEKRIFY